MQSTLGHMLHIVEKSSQIEVNNQFYLEKKKKIYLETGLWRIHMVEKEIKSSHI